MGSPLGIIHLTVVLANTQASDYRDLPGVVLGGDEDPLGQDKDDALFTGKRGPLTIHGLQRLWHRAIDRAGLPTEYSIHAARHTVAVHLLKETRNLRQVQKQLGHSSPTTTANMYADVSFADMGAGVEC